MDDDLDELLDEVEKRFCRNVSTRSPTQIPLNNASKCPRETDRINGVSKPENISDSEDIDAFLEELDESYKGSTRLQTEQVPKGPKIEGKSLSQSEEKKCCPVFLGGSSTTYGVGTLMSQRSCDQLRCTLCDFRVLMFDDHEWDTSCDYLFLRNNMPDRERLAVKLKRRRGSRAYACQCSWFTARDPTDLTQQPQFRWVCGKHPV